jgi:hypothetical protein
MSGRRLIDLAKAIYVLLSANCFDLSTTKSFWICVHYIFIYLLIFKLAVCLPGSGGRAELLRTEIGITKMGVIYELCVSFCFF